MCVTDLNRSVETVLKQIGVACSPSAIEKLAAYSQELIRWNTRTNLTGAKSAEEFVAGPLFDAMTLVPVLKKSMESFVDIGSGGGLPGIPAAIVASLGRVSLVEPRSLRASFLRHIVHFLSLDAMVLEGKDKALVQQWEGAVSQAVFEPLEWAARGLPLVQTGGCIYVLSSERLPVSALPNGLTLDAEFECTRPLKQARRFSYRLLRIE
jgi:16S rRNA (guanine527-N7)-methyltransferase